MNAFIFNSDCSWYHNYWGATQLIPMPWILPIPKLIIGFSPYSFHVDVDWRPALKPNCDFGGED